MRSRNSIFRFSLILVMLFMGGCGRSNNIPTETLQAAITPTNSPPSSSSTPTLRNSTPTPRVTSTPISSATPTPDPVSSATMHFIPTLTVKEARARLKDLTANNGFCQLPCLWGITPGATKNLEAETMLVPLSSISDWNIFKPEIGTIGVNDFLDNGQYLNILFGYLASQDIVYSVHFQAQALKTLAEQNGVESIFDSPDFGGRLDFYMLHQLLSTQGQPNSVLLNTWGEFPPPHYGQGHFQLILIYPEKGIIVQYTTEMEIVGKNVEGCLANAHVEIDLFPEGNVDAFYEQLALRDWKWRIEYYKPIEEVTSMSVDDFYQAFREPRGKCLQTPANMWPLPED